MNESIFKALNNLAGRSDLLDKIIIFVADPFVWIVIAVMLAYALLRPHGRKERLVRFILILVGGVIAWGFASFIKDIVASTRPFIALPSVRELIMGEHDFSFPSGHTTFMFALASGLYYHHKRWGIVLGMFALAVGVARVVAGIHWPIDILGGIILGVVVGYVAQYLFSVARRR